MATPLYTGVEPLQEAWGVDAPARLRYSPRTLGVAHVRCKTCIAKRDAHEGPSRVGCGRGQRRRPGARTLPNDHLRRPGRAPAPRHHRPGLGRVAADPGLPRGDTAWMLRSS